MKNKILITGGTGMLGSRLTELLLKRGYEVCYLSREGGNRNGITSYKWDIETGYVDENSLVGVSHIVHLTGAGIADKPWSVARKKEIIDSRVKSAELLHEMLAKNNHAVKSFVSASAIGYYGGDTGSKLLEEATASGNDFLAEVTQKWEQSADKIEEIGIRIVKVRIGIVLSSRGGALPKLAMPIKLGAGSYIGNGNQYMSWIHIDDLCGIFMKAIEDKSIHGAYNAVAPNPVTNKEFTKVLAKTLKRWVLPLYIPIFLLKLILGEMSVVVTGGSNISCKKILETGFQFQFRTVESALEEIYNS